MRTKHKAVPPPESARRAQIVDCAIASIAELGFAQASVDQIAMGARRADGRPFLAAEAHGKRVEDLEALLRAGQRSGEFRRFSTHVMALAILQTLDGVPPLLARDPGLDLKSHGKELAIVFDLATRRHSS